MVATLIIIILSALLAAIYTALRQRQLNIEDENDDHPMWVHALLFVAALLTMWLAGISFAEQNPWDLETWRTGKGLGAGASYALSLMAILYCHEMGHYLQGKRHGVEMSRPYFLPGIPIPGGGVMPFMGTFGAFIRMRLARIDADALLKVGAWGPLAGFLVTVPVLLIGFSLSEVKPLPEDPAGALRLGDTLLLLLGEALFHPNIPEGSDVFLHPMAMAGWTGGLLTALNLLPIGQLDGGHICYSVFGERYNRVAWVLWGGLLVMGVVGFTGWLVLAGLLFWMRPVHPDIMAGEPVRGPGLWLAVASLVMLVLTFSPTPIAGMSLLDLLR